MKTKSNVKHSTRLTPDSQKRLVAYTTAAGLGALFTGQNLKAQVTESMAFAPYPAILPADASTNTTDFPFDVEGDGSNDFQFIVFGQSNVVTRPWHANQLIDVRGFTTNSVGTNVFLDNGKHSYLQAWYGGLTINATNGIPPSYKPRLAISYNYGPYYINLLDNKFKAKGALGFQFVSGVDNQLHFGYMDVGVNSKTITNADSSLEHIITSLTVYDVYYNQTPNAGITVPGEVVITNFTLGPTNAVTIDFSSNTNAPASAFTLLTSPTLGSSANWTPVPAVITQTAAANPNGGLPLSYYQAVTNTSGGPSQYFRIKQN